MLVSSCYLRGFSRQILRGASFLIVVLLGGNPSAEAGRLDDYFRERTSLVNQSRSDSAFLERQERDEQENFNRKVFYSKIETLEKEIDLENEKLEEEKEEEEEEGKEEPEETKEKAADRFLEPETEEEKPIFFNIDLPVYSSSFTYNSNLFSERKKPQDDLIRGFSLTVPAYAGLGEWKYQSQVLGSYSSFEQFPENDTGAIRWVQVLKLEANRLNVEFENGMGRSFPSDLTDTRGSWADVFETRLGYRLTPKTTWTADYEHAQTFNLDPARGGRMLHRASNGLSYQWTPKTRLGLGYSHIWEQNKKSDSKEFRDANRHRIFASFFHSNRSRLSLNILGGVALRDFNQPSIHTVGLKVEWDVFGSASYLLTPKTSLSLGVGRGSSSAQATPEADGPRRYTGSVGLAYKMNRAWSLRSAYSLGLDEDRQRRTVVDPEHFEITTTKFDKSIQQAINLAVQYKPLQNLTFAIDYGLSQVFNELQDKEYVGQKIGSSFNYAF